jgi:hydroxylamine reductase
MSLKDLFFGNDTESEEKDMSEVKDLITPDMLVGDIITKHPLAAQFLMECGMGCIHCPASAMESLTEACAVHGIDSEEITDALNEYLAEHNA